MATQMQLKVLFGRNSHGRQDFWKEKTTTSPFFFHLIFDVYTHVDNRERLERVIANKGDEFRCKKNMKMS